MAQLQAELGAWGERVGIRAATDGSGGFPPQHFWAANQVDGLLSLLARIESARCIVAKIGCPLSRESWVRCGESAPTPFHLQAPSTLM